MNENAPSMEIAAPRLVIVAEGATSSAQANARGHLFERFMSRVFEAYGCEPPQVESLNVRSNGYELDIATTFTLSRDPAIAECKAYSAALPISALSEFYGKLATERLVGNPRTHGWFVAIPGLTSEGHQLARQLEAKDKAFRSITAAQIYELVKQKRWIEPIQPISGSPVSDEGILLTESGICAIAKELDPSTRLPIRVLVRRLDGPLPTQAKLLLAGTDYASALRVDDLWASEEPSRALPPVEPQTLVTVAGSREDFEYQFPAAPEFFVGREKLIKTVVVATQTARAHGQVFVLNAQSGWGKSSLALRIAHQVHRSGGYSIVFDTRTAATPPYVAAALQRAATAAAERGILRLREDFSFASLQNAVQTLQSAEWLKPDAGLLVFFDQFENVFRDSRLTQEFRDLALSIRDITVPVFIGFSWKTDLVGLTENYPYRLRDDIRMSALVLNVEPFGPKEVGTVLGRLARAANTKLSPDLRQRIREYSQGLPWLLKKLASHILAQLRAGTSEEVLLAESLNVQQLFEQDIKALQASELDALKGIAREAPVAVVDVVERVSPDVIQSLVDQRLLVRVGERLDVYWDTFREFLINGSIAVEDSYILRLRPASTSRLIQLILDSKGEIATSEAVSKLSTSQNVVFNAARELRQLGVIAPRQGVLSLVEQLRPLTMESQIQSRVARSLRRHRLYGVVQSLLSVSPTVSVDEFASKLPPVFPAIEASAATWRTYADAFAYWLDYSGLIQLRGQLICPPSGGSRTRLLARSEAVLRVRPFPQGTPDLAVTFLRDKWNGQSTLPRSSAEKAAGDLEALGVLDRNQLIKNHTVAEALVQGNSANDLLHVLRDLPGAIPALGLIEAQPDVRPEVVGTCLRNAYGLPWASETTRVAGAKFRAWARAAGVKVVKVPRKKAT